MSSRMSSMSEFPCVHSPLFTSKDKKHLRSSKELGGGLCGKGHFLGGFLFCCGLLCLNTNFAAVCWKGHDILHSFFITWELLQPLCKTNKRRCFKKRHLAGNAQPESSTCLWGQRYAFCKNFLTDNLWFLENKTGNWIKRRNIFKQYSSNDVCKKILKPPSSRVRQGHRQKCVGLVLWSPEMKRCVLFTWCHITTFG